jgi:hypothetical protein
LASASCDQALARVVLGVLWGGVSHIEIAPRDLLFLGHLRLLSDEASLGPLSLRAACVTRQIALLSAHAAGWAALQWVGKGEHVKELSTLRWVVLP